MRQYQYFICVMFSEPETRNHRNPSLARRGTPSFLLNIIESLSDEAPPEKLRTALYMHPADQT